MIKLLKTLLFLIVISTIFFIFTTRKVIYGDKCVCKEDLEVKINMLSKELEKISIKTPIIIDTDFSEDIDDAVALKLALTMEQQDLADIRAVVVNNYTDKICPALDAFLSYYGHQNCDIGWDTTKAISMPSTYHEVCIKSGTYRYNTTESYPDAIKVYRRQLAKTHNKITVVSIGFLTNLQNLLKSTPDEYSSLSGTELVAQKVEHIYIMGGIVSSFKVKETEYNFAQNIKAAQYVLENCPVPITLLSFSAGQPKSGQNLHNIYASKSEDLLYEIFATYKNPSVINKGRNSWDPMTVYLAIIGNVTKCGYSKKQGTYVIDNNNFSQFIQGKGNHNAVYRLKNEDYYKEQINSKLF